MAQELHLEPWSHGQKESWKVQLEYLFWLVTIMRQGDVKSLTKETQLELEPFFLLKISFYCYSSTVVSIFLPPLSPAPLSHTFLPQSFHPLALSMNHLYMFLDNPFPSFPCYFPPLPSLATVSLLFIIILSVNKILLTSKEYSSRQETFSLEGSDTN